MPLSSSLTDMSRSCWVKTLSSVTLRVSPQLHEGLTGAQLWVAVQCSCSQSKVTLRSLTHPNAQHSLPWNPWAGKYTYGEIIEAKPPCQRAGWTRAIRPVTAIPNSPGHLLIQQNTSHLSSSQDCTGAGKHSRVKLYPSSDISHILLHYHPAPSFFFPLKIEGSST